MSSIRAKFMRSISSAYIRRLHIGELDIHRIRRRWSRIGHVMMTAIGVRVEPDRINGLYVEWLTPKGRMDGKLLLYLHGGGYVVGSCDMYRQLVSHIARAGQIRTLLPEYRLAPEHRFPAAIDDSVALYRSLLAMGIKAGDIIIAGDSAGGGLTVATLLALRDAGEPLPAAAVLLSPFLDLTGSGESMRTRAAQDPFFRAEDLPDVADLYCEPHQRRFPLVSPVFADIEGLPPMFIQVGDDEILLSDSERIADACIAAGIAVELEIWPEMWHVFQMFVGKMPEARHAVNKIGQYILTRWREQPASPSET
ncbi:MAG: alpha/beta hydrolase [Gammaproteobacteria bacterium]|nr:alpha/beta hydrolase [Gammaproteobacteria bacterium]